MKSEIKKIALIILTVTFIISGSLGAAIDAIPDVKKMKPGQKDISLKQIPKFQKLKFVNKVQGYTPELTINDSLPEPGPGVKEFEIHPKDLNNIQVTLPGGAWPMYSIHLIYRDKISEIDSKEQIVPWENSRDKKAEIPNIFGEKLEGVDATLEIDKDTLTITVERKAEAKKKADNKESMTKNKNATF